MGLRRPNCNRCLLLLLISVSLLFLYPRPALSSSPGRRHLRLASRLFVTSKFAVIFDAGSTGSRVHVYCFDSNMDLIKFGDGYELSRKLSPGLSAYAENPKKGAESLIPLLDAAIAAVPTEERSQTPVRLGATAGLRLLPGDSAMNLLNAVATLLAASPFEFESKWVSILDGSQEGAFSWISVNYLLGRIGNDIGGTVGTIDLGGGSVQMSYAISDDAAAHAPAGTDTYITELNLLGHHYHLYVHSYLGYGLLAGRAEVLKLVQDSASCPCIPKGFEGNYTYNSVTYKVVGSNHSAHFVGCAKLVQEALDLRHLCNYTSCTFDGVWSGGGGAGQKHLYVASFFFDRAMQAGIITDPDAIEAIVKPSDFGRLARRVCKLDVHDIGKRFPSLDEVDRPFFCLDLTFEYTLLVNGLGVKSHREITLVKQINYKNSSVDAQWTLGSAIDVLSNSSPTL